jgi:hypothetical protein
VTAIAATWLTVWRDAHGDTTRMRKPRQVAPREVAPPREAPPPANEAAPARPHPPEEP